MDKIEIRLLSRIAEEGATYSGMHIYTNVTAKERRLIRKFERTKLVSINQSWVKLTPAGQSLVDNHEDTDLVAAALGLRSSAWAQAEVHLAEPKFNAAINGEKLTVDLTASMNLEAK